MCKCLNIVSQLGVTGRKTRAHEPSAVANGWKVIRAQDMYDAAGWYVEETLFGNGVVVVVCWQEW
jgi:hypothetical protein